MINPTDSIFGASVSITIAIFIGVIKTAFIDPCMAEKERKREKREHEEEQEDRKKKWREELYRGLGNVYFTFKKKIEPFFEWDTTFFYLKTHNSFATVIDTLDLIMTDDFDAYEFMRKDDPMLFYQIQDVFALADIYRTLKLSIKELLRVFHDLNKMELLPYEEKGELSPIFDLKSAQELHQTIFRQFQWVTGRLRSKLKTKKIDIDLLVQFISDEDDKNFLTNLAQL
jgi:hypothetical protein